MQEMQETWVPSLGREDPLEKEIAAHSSIVDWKIPWTKELGGLQSLGLQSQTQLSTYTHWFQKSMFNQSTETFKFSYNKMFYKIDDFQYTYSKERNQIFQKLSFCGLLVFPRRNIFISVSAGNIFFNLLICRPLAKSRQMIERNG